MQDQSAPGAENIPRLLFIVGLWRSGTSLLHALVNRHPGIALMYEAEPLDLWPRRGMPPSGDWPQRLEFFNQTFSRHHLDARQFASLRPGPDAALALYREYARAKAAKIAGEKAPSYYGRLPILGTAFPDALFLIVWRDPLECCRSAVRAARQNRFFAQRGMSQRILLGAETLARGVETLIDNKRNLCEVVYDELVRNPEPELRRICEFLKVPFDPSMLDLKSADTSSLPTGEHHLGVRSGIIGKNPGAGEVLPADFIAKGGRYASLWKRQFSKLAFARALPAQDSTGPGFIERLRDCCTRNFWRAMDGFKRILFRNIPFSCWAWLRSRPR